MTTSEVMRELAAFGNEQTKKTFTRHGIQEPFYGVKVQDLKKILKKTKKNHSLALELFKTGNYDAMYLAGLMADENKMTKEALNDWVQKAYCSSLSEYTVPWIAAETPFGFELGLAWIQSEEEGVASAGWATLSSFAGVNADENLDIKKYSELLDVVERNIQTAKNRVRYTMNGFVIATGGFIAELTEKALKTANNLGKIQVEMGGTACKVPLATAYIQKMIDKNKVGNKRKSARC